MWRGGEKKEGEEDKVPERRCGIDKIMTRGREREGKGKGGRKWREEGNQFLTKERQKGEDT